MDYVFKLNIIFTAAMFGVIWIVQLVHYPMFAGLERETFVTWHKYHSDRISYVVIPLMIGELLTSIAMFWMLQDATSLVLLGLTVSVWASTFFVSVPLHNALGAGDHELTPRQIQKLVSTNWIRTLLYSMKIVLLFFVTFAW